ncbi:DUF4270 family protein [Wenyingzhuangia sp. IMCC45574]
MTIFNKGVTKTIGALGAMVFFMSCTNEIPEDAAGLIDEESFVRETLNSVPVLSTVAVDKVQTNALSSYILGQYTTTEFGVVKSNLIGQLQALSTTDEVVAGDLSNVEAYVELPLALTLKADTTDEYEVANFIGSNDSQLSLKVSTFTTFLERFNVGGDVRDYYSDGTNNGGSKENLGTQTDLGVNTNVVIEPSYSESSLSIKIPLDLGNYDFKTEFLEKYNDIDATSYDEFVTFFKGLKIDVETLSGDGFVFPVNLSTAKLKIAYEAKDGEAEAVNDTLSFGFSGVVYSEYDHDHNKAAEANKEYVQGAGGYEVAVNIDDFVTENRTKYQEEQWLVNQATIKVYLDDFNDDTLFDFYIYAIDKDDNVVALDDYTFFGIGAVDGIVRYDDVENQTDPYVRFFVTDFMKDVLSYSVDGETITGVDIKELRIKARGVNDGVVVDSSLSSVKGAVLLNDTAADKAPKLEVVYSKLDK